MLTSGLSTAQHRGLNPYQQAPRARTGSGSFPPDAVFLQERVRNVTHAHERRPNPLHRRRRRKEQKEPQRATGTVRSVCVCAAFKLDAVAAYYTARGLEVNCHGGSKNGLVAVRMPAQCWDGGSPLQAARGPAAAAPQPPAPGAGTSWCAAACGCGTTEAPAEAADDFSRTYKLDTDVSQLLQLTADGLELSPTGNAVALAAPDTGQATFEVFFFAYGVVVWWSPFPPKVDWEMGGEALLLEVERQAADFEIDSRVQIEPETCLWNLEPVVSKSGEDWGGASVRYGLGTMIDCDCFTLREYDTLVMAAYSFGLAQSAKLSDFEEAVQDVVRDAQQNRFPEMIEEDSHIPGGTELGKRRGEVFLHRLNLNLYTDILDTPDWFWSRTNLEDAYYAEVRRYMEIAGRTEVLNKRLGVLHELFDTIGEERKTRESDKLEIIIIWLLVADLIVSVFTFALPVLRRLGAFSGVGSSDGAGIAAAGRLL
eukprot:TRINITY_DN64843_c0_g1_i1.p1 TRINITY_DN64843_c0_g1~~TRINITY_DN64843_c0_g1_i1.p1  ORF type:complete len:482 (+),score=119.71 TRINITY_DN64843_c0_g1_i1:80-1525(+)